MKTNETSTTIKSKALSITKQSVAVDRSGQEVSSRGLTLAEILSHSTHYAPNMRKECLAGVKDFFTLHPRLIDAKVGAVLDKVAHLVTDQDVAVRKELRSLVALFLGEASQSCLAPFLGMYLVHVCGGLSHIQEHVRASALQLLDDVVPAYSAIVARFAPRLLPTFIQLLSNGETLPLTLGKDEKSQGVKERRVPKLCTMSLSAREAILNSMHAYLRATATHVAPDNDTFFSRLAAKSASGVENARDVPREESEKGHKSKRKILAGGHEVRQVVWSETRRAQLGIFRKALGTGHRAEAAMATANIWDAAGFVGGGAAGTDGGGGAVMAGFCEGAITLLVQCWQELWPLGAEDKGGLRVMLQVLDSLRLLFSLLPALRAGSALQWRALERQAGLACRALMGSFALGPEDCLPASPAELRRANCTVLEIVTAGLALGCAGSGAGLGRGPSDGGGGWGANGPYATWLQLLEFVFCELSQAAAAMRGFEGKKGKRAGSNAEGKAAGDAAADLIPALSQLLWMRAGAVGDEFEGVFTAFAEAFDAAPSSSRLKKVGVSFIAAQLDYWPHFAPPQAAHWIAAMPKLLWTLQLRDPALSNTVLELLASLARRSAALPEARALMVTLQGKIVPFFRATLPSGEAQAGPFVHLPPAAQRQALALLYFLAPLSTPLLGALAAALTLPALSRDTLSRALETVALLADARAQPLDAALSFFATVAVGGDSDGLEEESEDESRQGEGDAMQVDGATRGAEAKNEGGEGRGAWVVAQVVRAVETLGCAALAPALFRATTLALAARGECAGDAGGDSPARRRHRLRVVLRLAGAGAGARSGSGEESLSTGVAELTAWSDAQTSGLSEYGAALVRAARHLLVDAAAESAPPPLVLSGHAASLTP